MNEGDTEEDNDMLKRFELVLYTNNIPMHARGVTKHVVLFQLQGQLTTPFYDIILTL
jgi:hypothetical protein